MDEIEKLWLENKTMREMLIQQGAEISKLEARLASIESKQEPVQAQEIIEEVKSKVEEKIQAAKVEFISAKQGLTKEVMKSIEEENLQKGNQTVLRVGGLPEGWDRVDVIEPEEVEKDIYISEGEELERRLTRALPFVDIGKPGIIEAKGRHAIVQYMSRREKIEVLKQSKSLKGTKFWISDELTPMQLKEKKVELAKVKEARAAGKWAVYRGGKAIIGEFRKSSSTPR